MLTSSTPNLSNFEPLPHQYKVIYDIRREFNYDKHGTYEVMLSGAVGSAKSIVMAHVGVTHCMLYPGAVLGIGRLALPRLKQTLCQKIREHLYNIGAGFSYTYNETSGGFKFSNGSRIEAFSWSDKHYDKFRSYELSAMLIEELSENKGDHWNAYLEAFSRVGRLGHVPERFVMSATNPDSPSHPAYQHFIEDSSETRRVYYSITTDNPYLPATYVENLKSLYDDKMYERMVLGRWVEISTEVIYYTYDKQENYRDTEYKPVLSVPVVLAFDFNIALGKPLSVAVIQEYRGDTHIYGEVTVEGLRTRDALEELMERGYLGKQFRYIIRGDATGRHRDTRSNQSDYDIIEDFLTRHGFVFDIDVPRSNPPIKTRHNMVNGRIRNAKGERHLFVYKDAPMADKGLRLTVLKDNAKYIEDDSPAYQHITTAIGYHICAEVESDLDPGGMIKR